MPSAGLEFWDFLHKIISHLSFCFAWLITELGQIILMRFISLRDVSGMCCNALPKQTRISCGGGRMNLACMWIREVFLLTFEEIFSALSNVAHWTEESTPQIVFVLLINGRFFTKALRQLLPLLCVCVCVSSWVCAPVKVCVIELCRQRISRNLSSAMLKLARRQTWRLTKELIIIILEKWSKVSFYSPPDQDEGCLSLWEDVWLPPLYVCFGPLSWFSYTSTFSSKHVKIFHAH